MASGKVDALDVSRETLLLLESFAEEVARWTKNINLIAPSSIPDLWARHIVDSAQLICGLSVPDQATWVDLGSGGGFPGIVLAIIAKEKHPGLKFTLIESDTRKSAFLKLQTKSFDLNVNVVSKRIENAEPSHADFVSARALAPLKILLGYVFRHINPEGIALIPKGRHVDSELLDSWEDWSFDVDRQRSKLNDDSTILKILNLRKRAASE